MRSDNFDGSGFATYGKPATTTKGKGGTQDNSSSQIGTDGNWSLSWGSPRSVYVTPNQPVGLQPPPSVPIPTAGSYRYAGHSGGVCRTPEGAPLPFTSLGLGITYPCQLGVEIHYPDSGSGDLVYKLAMGPALPWGGPPTGVAGVVCISVANNQCAEWTITSAPDENGQNQNVANLYYYQPNAGQWVWLGQYYNSFRIHVKRNP
jgi:hypothetical protein